MTFMKNLTAQIDSQHNNQQNTTMNKDKHKTNFLKDFIPIVTNIRSVCF
jgi:hypothetical protein